MRGLGIQMAKSIDEQDRERFHPLDMKSHFSGPVDNFYYKNSVNGVKMVSIKKF